MFDLMNSSFFLFICCMLVTYIHIDKTNNLVTYIITEND